MDGIHDLGGMQGLGPVAHSPAEPVFHERWEAVARALMEAVAGAIDATGGEFRHSIERMDPGHYLTSGYYEHWLTAAATLAVEHGLVTRSELEARAGGRFPLSGPVLAPPVADPGPAHGGRDAGGAGGVQVALGKTPWEGEGGGPPITPGPPGPGRTPGPGRGGR